MYHLTILMIPLFRTPVPARTCIYICSVDINLYVCQKMLPYILMSTVHKINLPPRSNIHKVHWLAFVEIGNYKFNIISLNIHIIIIKNIYCRAISEKYYNLIYYRYGYKVFHKLLIAKPVFIKKKTHKIISFHTRKKVYIELIFF